MKTHKLSARLALAAWIWAGLCGFVRGQTQDYMVRTWGVDDGLPEGSVSDVVQADDGYLWVSTLNSGLSRFDGNQFVTVDLPAVSPFRGVGVRRLFVNADGGLWINGFGNYLASLHNGVFQLEPARPEVINWLVWQGGGRVLFAIKEGQLLERSATSGTNSTWQVIPVPGASQWERFFADANADIWCRRTDGKLSRLHDGVIGLVPLPDGNPPATALAGDRQGTIMVGTARGLFGWENGTFADMTPTNGGSAKELHVLGIVSDGQGGWWVEANDRLRRCVNRRWVAEAGDWLGQNRSWSLVHWEEPDFDGGFWAAYRDGGLLHVDPMGRLTALTIRDGLPSNRVRTLMQDSEGDVWATFELGGLARIKPQLFQSLGRSQGLADSVTTSVSEDETGSIWIGSLSGKVSCWREGRCKNYTLPGAYSEISTVCADGRGRVWIGTHGNGIQVFENGRFRPVLSVDQVGANIRGLFTSRDGRLWIASQSGLFGYADGRLDQIRAPATEVDYPVAVTQGGGDRIWVAMNSGRLLKGAGGKWTDIQPTNTAMRVRFSAVCEDAEGAVWVGTLGAGLLCYREGQFTAITRQDGLPTDNIFQVITDEAGGLWLGTSAGVVYLGKTAALARGEKPVCRVYGRDAGLPTVGCASGSQPAAWRARDGRLWFATVNGVASVLPRNLETRSVPPRVAIEAVVVDGQADPNFEPYQGVSGDDPLRLSPGRHHVTFRFTGLSFSAPERIRFKYILEGLDKDWTENSADRSASYASLPSGHYRFRVQACNGDGVWSEGVAAVSLVVPPHVWETLWFEVSAMAAVLVLVSGSLLAAMRVRHRRQMRELEQQRALEHERTRIAQDIHDDLGASLTRITMLSQSALNKTETAASPANEVTRIYTTARAMTNAMDEIVWAINPRHDSIESVAAYFADFVEEFLSPTGLRFRIDFPLSLPAWTITAETRHNLFLAFKEALNNAVRHARATEVVVTMEIRGNGFCLAVEDNGCGFDAAAAGGNSSGRAVHSNGLQNMRSRLGELGGCCMIDSNPGRGTRVRFEMALRK